MKKKISKLAFLFCLPGVAFLTLAIFLISGFSNGYVSALSGNGGGLFVRSNSTLEIGDETTISGNTATNGGGVYVESGGKFYFGNFFVGDIIEFGSYPKTHQSDTSVITDIVDENGYYIGTDGTSRYAKASANPYVEQYVFYDGTTIVKGTEYYFKVEPIKWKVLSVENGRVLLFCEDIIDAHRFNYTNNDRTINDLTIYGNNYKYSDIRAWLNGYGQEEGNNKGEDWSTGGFLQTAFTEEEQNLILTTEVDNSAETTVSSQITYVCENTNDKIFLLSYQDMINTEYGFSSSFAEDTSRQKLLTDYAIANNADYYNYYYRTGSYWLRSPYCGAESDDHNVFQVSNYLVSTSVSQKNVGVVPALYMSETELESCLISENTASNLGGGVYVDDGGNFNMTNGTISGNTASSGNGNDIYNAGTFMMTGGTVGVSENEQTGYGIYNTGTMNLRGGTVYDNIYSSTSFTTTPSASLNGTITLGDSAIITVENYNGTTPMFKIVISEEREDGTIIKFKGSSVEPDVSKLIIIGRDLCETKIEVVQSSSTEWNVNIKEVLYIRIDENGNENENGKYVLFGSYPKTVKSDDVEIITSSANAKGYFYGSDGNQYVKVDSANPYEDSSLFTDGTTISSGETYYFKVEPIKWRILKETNGKALLFCEDIIDLYKFNNSIEDRYINGETIRAGNYKYSDVRAWLNGYSQEFDNKNGENHLNSGFLQKAFSKKAQNIITITNVDNSTSSTYNSDNNYTCENTNDKIFLLSDQDMLNTTYGFNSDHMEYDVARQKKPTDYLRVNCYEYKYESQTVGYYNTGYYILRSPASVVYGKHETAVSPSGICCVPFSIDDSNNNSGIVPALTISFKAKTCSHSSLSSTQAYITLYENGESNGCYLKKTYECKSCGYSYFEIGEIVDHSFSVTNTNIVSDGETGHHTKTNYCCTRCSFTKTIESETESHSGFSVINTKYVSVGPSGHYIETTEKCSSCSYTRIQSDESLIDHNFSSWRIDGDITAIDETTHYWINSRYCYDCLYVESQSDSSEHTFETTIMSTVSDGSSGHHTVTKKKCSSCSYTTTITGSTVSHSLSTTSTSTISDGDSGHYTVTNKKCSSCSYTTKTTGSTVSHSLSTTSTNTVSDGSSGHHTETNKKCSKCSYTTTITGSTTDHSLSTTYSYLQIDNTYHNRTTTKKCSDCSYSTTSTKKMMHALGTDEVCSCGYSPNLAFSSTINSLEIVDNLIYFDEKKYLSAAYEAKQFEI